MSEEIGKNLSEEELLELAIQTRKERIQKIIKEIRDADELEREKLGKKVIDINKEIDYYQEKLTKLRGTKS
jgi:hypothetical protein